MSTAARILTTVRQLNFTSFPLTLAVVEPGRKQVLIVENWAEIRRLRKSEGVSISEIARVMGCARNTVKAALVSDGRPKMSGDRAGRVDRRRSAG